MFVVDFVGDSLYQWIACFIEQAVLLNPGHEKFSLNLGASSEI